MLLKKILQKLKKPFKFVFYRSRASFLKFTTDRYVHLFRPSSYPYLSGDTLRKFSDHIYDETSKKKEYKINDGDVVFVNSEYLCDFLKYVNIKHSKTKFKIVAHNNDTEINSQLIQHIDYSNVQIWAQNLTSLENENLNMLPIGFENRRFLKNGKLKFIKNVQFNKIEKSYLVTSNFNSNTNYKIRYPIEVLFNSVDFVDTKKYNTKEYLQNLSKYKFSICPSGNGVDTHRIWESLFVNTIPVVIKDNFSSNLVKNDIPCLVLNKWEDFLQFDQQTLSNIYEDFVNRYFFREFLSFEFWWHRIKR